MHPIAAVAGMLALHQPGPRNDSAAISLTLGEAQLRNRWYSPMIPTNTIKAKIIFSKPLQAPPAQKVLRPWKQQANKKKNILKVQRFSRAPKSKGSFRGSKQQPPPPKKKKNFLSYWGQTWKNLKPIRLAFSNCTGCSTISRQQELLFSEKQSPQTNKHHFIRNIARAQYN